MSTVLSDTELTDIHDLKSKGVLEEIKGEMTLERYTVFVPCADGHCFHDLYNQHITLCGNADMHHPLSLNGGALLIPKESPLLVGLDGRRYHEDETYERHLRLAIGLKAPHAIVLYAHAPCGMARRYGLSIMDEFELLVAAKDRVREWMRSAQSTQPHNIDVQVRFHVTYNSGRRRSYHFRRPMWTDYVRGRQNLTA